MRRDATRRLILLAAIAPLVAAGYACCILPVESKRVALTPDRPDYVLTRQVRANVEPPPPDYPTEWVRDTYTPELGEHTTEILASLGYTQQQIDRVLDQGVAVQCRAR